MLSEGLNGTETKRKTEVEQAVQKQSFLVLNIVKIYLSQLSRLVFFVGVINFYTFFAVGNIFGLPFQVRRGKH